MAEGRSHIDEASPLAMMGLSATLAAEMILGKIRITHHHPEPPYLQPVRNILLQYRKAVGAEDFDKFTDELKPTMHALAAMLFDEVTGVRLPSTAEKVKALSVPHKMAIEVLVANMTGKTGGHRTGRWEDGLYTIKCALQQICALSISNITLEDVRNGYDPFLHALVDELYEHRKTLVS